MAVATYTKSGAKAATPAKLDKAIFGVEVKNHQLLKEAYLSYLANGRSNNAVAKRRGQVRGGGRKPWRQKGTGNARFGSSRNPIWRGGGTAFGPTGNENYSRKLSTAAKRAALRQALSLAANEGRIIVIESLNISDGKTKSAEKLLGKIEARGNVLLIVDQKDEKLSLATRNLAGISLKQAKYLSVYDVTNADRLVLDNAALAVLSQWLGSTK
jgi:large subunit ribosomal protein L4